MNNYKNKRVLVLDGNSRQILPVLHGLSKLKCSVVTVNESKLDNGYTSRYVNKRLLKSESNIDKYYGELLSEIKTRNYDVLIPLSDKLMNLTTAHLEEILRYVRFPFANREVFLRAYDKQKTMEYCMDYNVPCPITKRNLESMEEFISKTSFPIIAKPRMACGSIGLKIVSTKEQLDRLISSGEIVVEQYVIQEYIPQTGKQINVHLFMDDNQQLKSAVVAEKSRWYPVSGGASCLCRTVTDNKVLSDCERLLRVINWRSYCEIDLIVDPRDKIAKVVEINGRASANIKIMELVGVDVTKQMMQLAYDESVESMMNYEQDVRLRRYLQTVYGLFSPQIGLLENRFGSVL